MSVQGTYWRMTINNYDETDLALVQQGYPDHVRQLVYTLEEGEEGTPHIQAYIRMKRDVRLSAMKKLFPRGNFGKIDGTEYNINSQRYAQKLDVTARSPATITNWDPLLTIEGVMKQVITKIMDDYEDEPDLDTARRWVQKELVVSDYKYAKVFVSATYKTMWRDYGHEMYECIFRQREESVEVTLPTHTHTHTDEKFSQPDENARSTSRNRRSSRTCSESSQKSSSGDESESIQNGDCETVTDESESISSGDSQEDDC